MDYNIPTSPAYCSSRFHNPNGQIRVRVGARTQYICPACREKWQGRSQTAQQINEQSTQEESEAARILAQMVRDGIISTSDLPDWLMTEPSESDSSQDIPQANRYTSGTYPESLDVYYQGRELKFNESEDNLETRKSQTLTANPALSFDIFNIILEKLMDAEPKCALELLVPDWNICKAEDPDSANSLTNIVTYTKGVGYQASSFTKDFHADEHILLPMKILDGRALTLNKWCYDEVVRLFYQKGTQVFQLTVDTVPDNIADESFLTSVQDTYPLRGQEIRRVIPFDDDLPSIPNRKMPLSQSYVFKLLRHLVIRSPLSLREVTAYDLVGFDIQVSDLNLGALEMAIDLDRATPIWPSWSQMPQLESVLLDLRAYSSDLNTELGYLGKDEIVQRAQEMGRCLNLKLLVIAGLQSYDFMTGDYGSYTVERIETDDEINGEPNWIKVFMPAIRPGGKIILVDRLMDNLLDLIS